MQINVKLDQGFTDQFYELSKKYGDEMRNLNGLSEGQLNFTEFIDHFVDKNSKNVADASIDGNSNVGTKDVTSLLNEMNKPHMKLLSLNKIYYEMKKQHGARKANEWLEGEWSGKFYLHDSFNSSFLPYCIMPQECCSFIYNGKRIHCSFIDIYNMLDEPEEHCEEGDIFYKRPKNLLVLDYDTELKSIRYTRVSVVSKKNSDKDFYFVKSHNGANLITTEDHGFITSNGEVPASMLREDEDTLYCIDDSSQFTNSIYEYNGLELTSELGWLVGMYLAEGYEQGGQLSICQSPDASPKEYARVLEILDKIGIPYKKYDTSNSFGDSDIKERRTIRLKNGDNNWEKKLKKIFAGKHCNEKRLCPDYCHFNDDFLRGLIAGLIDGDGTIGQNRQCMIRMTSRTLINQIREIGLHFGVFFGSRLPYIQSQNAKIKQTKPMYSANVNMNRNREFFLSLPSIKIQEKFTHFDYDEKFAAKNYVCEFGDIDVRDVEKTYKPSAVVFDLTTESHTFVCNNILVHNCYSYDLERVAKEGLFFVNDFNHEAPKHLVTFTDFVAEFVSWVSNRTSGGCSIPNYLVWSYYFWKHDVENGYFIRNPEYYRRQEFQRMIFKLNQPYLRITQSAYTTLSIMDEDYLVELFGGLEFPDGTLAIDHIEDIIEHEKVFMDVMRECHETNMMTFPVVSCCLIFDYEKHRFKHEEFAKWCSDTNAKWMDCNFSIDDAVNALSSCCRLRNSLEINNLGNFSSIGGSALEVGSVKVNSINLARIAYECKDEDDYIAILEKRVALCCEVLQVIRSIITRNVEKGLLPNYTLDIIDVSKQYCTIGVNALFEAVRKMGYVQKDEFECTNYTDRGIEFAKRIFDTITKVKQEYTDKYGFLYNIEQIPGERAAAVFLQKDKILFPNEEYTSTLYSNQWISLSEKTTMHDKVEVGEQLDSYMGGGVISHYNFDSSFADKEQAWKLLNYIADHHIPYFAFNGKVNSCEHNHGFYEDTCPICGGKPVTTWTRVVGFCVPRKNMSKERRIEHDHRWWEENKKFDFDSLM